MLSDRVRAGIEAAPWVIDEIKELEDAARRLARSSSVVVSAMIRGDVLPDFRMQNYVKNRNEIRKLTDRMINNE